MIEQIQAVGTVQAYSTVSIVPQVSGELISVGFKQGDLVQQGQLLFQIDPKPYQAQLDQVEANLQRDQAQLDNARTLVERNQKLVPKGYISRSDFDQLVSNEKALMGTIKADQAAVETAKLQLGYATIRAPIAGRTGNLLVHPGNIVTANNANEPLVVINQIEPIYVAFSVPEQRMLAIQREYSSSQSMPVTAIIDSKEGSVEVKGDLSFIDNTVDATTGTIQLKATFANADHLLWPGRFVTVKLPVTPIANALLVPTQAIQAGQQGSFIYVLGPENKAVYRPVTLGPVIDDNTVVIQGVKLGEQVITTGQFNLAEGVVVQVVNPKTTTITVDEKP
ncbi:MAG: efflux RND transporter periplasmic adaptor subunit [Coxiellaceae bacterium]|nr:MAG: efflux RND transporter periplasmic adaptor subunit [Coxiellaceae bacterium]